MEKINYDTFSGHDYTPLPLEKQLRLVRKAQKRKGKERKEAIDELVLTNSRYIMHYAKKFLGKNGRSNEDGTISLTVLFNDAVCGFIESIKRYDFTKKNEDGKPHALITYSIHWMKNYILKTIRENNNLYIPQNLWCTYPRIQGFVEEYLKKYERCPTYEEISKEVKITKESLVALLNSVKKSSLEERIDDSDDLSLKDIIPAKNQLDYLDIIDKKRLKENMPFFLNRLSERECKILRMRFGFDGEPMTLGSIAEIFGLSRERVRQIEKEAKAKLRKRIKKEEFAYSRRINGNL